MKLGTLLLQPYPINGNNIPVILSISFFIGLFMLVFEPFGLTHLEGARKNFILMGYGVVTFICLSFNLLYLPTSLKRTFDEQEWNFKKQLFFFCWILFTIGLVNYAYTLLTTDFFVFNLQGILLFQFYTFAVGLFPIVFLIMINQNLLYRKNLKSAAEINHLLTLVTNPSVEPEVKKMELPIPGENIMSIEPSTLLYIQAMGNYVMIHLLQDNNYQKYLVRCSLKEARRAAEPFSNIIQCHRAFIINISNVIHTEGNSQGYQLLLKGTKNKVPVSRRHIQTLKKHLKSTSNLFAL